MKEGKYVTEEQAGINVPDIIGQYGGAKDILSAILQVAGSETLQIAYDFAGERFSLPLLFIRKRDDHVLELIVAENERIDQLLYHEKQHMYPAPATVQERLALAQEHLANIAGDQLPTSQARLALQELESQIEDILGEVLQTGVANGTITIADIQQLNPDLDVNAIIEACLEDTGYAHLPAEIQEYAKNTGLVVPVWVTPRQARNVIDDRTGLPVHI